MPIGQLGLNRSGMANLASMAAMGQIPEDEEEEGLGLPPQPPVPQAPPVQPSPVLTQETLANLVAPQSSPTAPPFIGVPGAGQQVYQPQQDLGFGTLPAEYSYALPPAPQYFRPGEREEKYAAPYLGAEDPVTYLGDTPAGIPGPAPLGGVSGVTEMPGGRLPGELSDAAGDVLDREFLDRTLAESQAIDAARHERAEKLKSRIRDWRERVDVLETFDEEEPKDPGLLRKPTLAEMRSMAEEIGPTSYTDAIIRGEEDINKLKFEALLAADLRGSLDGYETNLGRLTMVIGELDRRLGDYPFAKLSIEPVGSPRWRTVVARSKSDDPDTSVLFGRSLSFWRELVSKPEEQWRAEVIKSFGDHPLGKYLRIPSAMIKGDDPGQTFSSVVNFLTDIETKEEFVPAFDAQGEIKGYVKRLVPAENADPTDLINRILANGIEAYKKLAEKGIEVSFQITNPMNILDPDRLEPERITFARARTVPPLPGLLHLARHRYALDGTLAQIAKSPLLQDIVHDYHTLEKDPNPLRRKAAQKSILQWMKGLFNSRIVWTSKYGYRQVSLGEETPGDRKESFARWADFLGSMVPIRESSWDGETWFATSGHMYLPIPDEAYDAAMSLTMLASMRSVTDDPRLIEGLKNLRLQNGGSYLDILHLLTKEEITRVVGNFPFTAEQMRAYDDIGFVDIDGLNEKVVNDLKIWQDYLRAKPEAILEMPYAGTFLQLIDGIRILEKNNVMSPARKLAMWRAAARTTPEDFEFITMLQSWADVIGSLAYHALIGIVTIGWEGSKTTLNTGTGWAERIAALGPWAMGNIQEALLGDDENIFYDAQNWLMEDAQLRMEVESERLKVIPLAAKAVLAHYAAYGNWETFKGRLKYQMPLVLFDFLGAADLAVNAPRMVGPTLAKPLQLTGYTLRRVGGGLSDIKRRVISKQGPGVGKGQFGYDLGKYDIGPQYRRRPTAELEYLDFGRVNGIGVRVTGFGDRIASVTYKNPHWYGRGLKSTFGWARAKYVAKSLDGTPSGRILAWGRTRAARAGELVQFLVEEARLHAKVTVVWGHKELVEGLSRLHLFDIHVPFREIYNQLRQTLRPGSTWGNRGVSIPFMKGMPAETIVWVKGLFTEAEEVAASLVTTTRGPRLKLTMLDDAGNRVPVTYNLLRYRVKMFEDATVRAMVTGPMSKHVRYWLKYPDDPMTKSQLKNARFTEKFQAKLARYGKSELTWLLDNADSLKALQEGRPSSINKAIWREFQNRVRHGVPGAHAQNLIEQDWVRIPHGKTLIRVRAKDYVDAVFRIGRSTMDKNDAWYTVTRKILGDWIVRGNVADAEKMTLRIGKHDINIIDLGLVESIGQGRFAPTKFFLSILRDRTELTALKPEGVTLNTMQARVNVMRRLISGAGSNDNGVFIYNLTPGESATTFVIRGAEAIGPKNYEVVIRALENLGIQESAVFGTNQWAGTQLLDRYVVYLQDMLGAGVKAETMQGEHFVLRYTGGPKQGKLVSLKEIEQAAIESKTSQVVKLLQDSNPRLKEAGIGKLLSVLAGGPAPGRTRSALVNKMKAAARKAGLDDEFVTWLGNRKEREAQLLPPDLLGSGEFGLNLETKSFAFSRDKVGRVAFDTTEHRLGRLMQSVGNSEEAVTALENLSNSIRMEKELSIAQKALRKRFNRNRAKRNPLVAIEAAFLQLTPEAQFALESYLSTGALPAILTDSVSISKGYAEAIFKQWEKAQIWRKGSDGAYASGSLTDMGIASSFVAHDMSYNWYKTLPHRVILDTIPSFNGMAHGFYDARNVLPEELHGLVGAIETSINDVKGRLGHLIANHASAGLIDDVNMYSLWNYITEVWTNNFDELVQAMDPLKERVITPVKPKRIAVTAEETARAAEQARQEPVFYDWQSAATATLLLLEARLTRVRMIHEWMKQGDILPAIGRGYVKGERIAPGVPSEWIRLDAQDHRVTEVLGKIHFGENWGKETWFIRKDKLDILRLGNQIHNWKGIGFQNTRSGFDYVYTVAKRRIAEKISTPGAILKQAALPYEEIVSTSTKSRVEKLGLAAKAVLETPQMAVPMTRLVLDVVLDALNSGIEKGSIVGEGVNSFAVTQWWKINKLFRGGWSPVMRNIWTNFAITAKQNPKAFLDPKFYGDMFEFVKDVANGNLSRDALLREFQEFSLGYLNLEGAASGGASGVGRQAGAFKARHGNVQKTAQSIDLGLTSEARDHLLRSLQEAQELVKLRKYSGADAMVIAAFGEKGAGGIMSAVSRGMAQEGKIGEIVNERLAQKQGFRASSWRVANDVIAYVSGLGRGGITGGDRFTQWFATWFNLGDGMFKYPLAKEIWFSKGPGAFRRLGITDDVKKWYKDRGLEVEKTWWRNPALANELGFMSSMDVYLRTTFFLPDYTRANEFIRAARMIDPFAYFQWKVMWGQFLFGMEYPAYTSILNEVGGWINAQQYDTPAEQFAYLYMRPEQRNRVADTVLGDFSMQFMNLSPDLDRLKDLGASYPARTLQVGYKGLTSLLSGDVNPFNMRSGLMEFAHEFTDHFFGAAQINLPVMAAYAFQPGKLNEAGITNVDFLLKNLRESGGSAVKRAASAGLGIPNVPRWKTSPYNTNLEKELWSNVLAAYFMGAAPLEEPQLRALSGVGRDISRGQQQHGTMEEDIKLLHGYDVERHQIYGVGPTPIAIAKHEEAKAKHKAASVFPVPGEPVSEGLIDRLQLRRGTTPQLLEYMPPPYSTMEQLTTLDPPVRNLMNWLRWMKAPQGGVPSRDVTPPDILRRRYHSEED